MAAPKKYLHELGARAVRLFRESEPKPVIRRLAEQLNVHHEALRNWIRQDQATRVSDMAGRVRTCSRRTAGWPESAELRRANEILKAEFAAELDPTRRRS